MSLHDKCSKVKDRSMNNTAPNLTQLKRAVSIAEQITALEAEMAAILRGTPAAKSAATSAEATPTGKRKRKKLSPQALANIRAAQQRRWAKVKGSKAPAAKKAEAPKAPAPSAPAPKKRKVSAAVRAKLAASMKARWAAAKAGKGPAPTSKKA